MEKDDKKGGQKGKIKSLGILLIYIMPEIHIPFLVFDNYFPLNLIT
jgi:hypothetical protein